MRRLHGLDDGEIGELVQRFRRFAVLVEPTRTIAAVEDDDSDNRFLGCAEAGEAAVVVGGDRHLLKLRAYRDIRVLSPAAVLALLDAEDRG